MIAQTPWFERSFNFDFPVTNFPVIFSRLEGSIFRLAHLLQNADEERCGYNADGWSVKEHIGHLSDLEELWFKRLGDFKESKPVLTVADLTNRKTHEALHNDKTLQQLINSFAAERQQTLETIYDFDEELLTKTALHPRLNKPMRVIDSLFFVAEHDDHHIAQISSLLRKPIG